MYYLITTRYVIVVFIMQGFHKLQRFLMRLTTFLVTTTICVLIIMFLSLMIKILYGTFTLRRMLWMIAFMIFTIILILHQYLMWTISYIYKTMHMKEIVTDQTRITRVRIETPWTLCWYIFSRCFLYMAYIKARHLRWKWRFVSRLMFTFLIVTFVTKVVSGIIRIYTRRHKIKLRKELIKLIFLRYRVFWQLY